MMSKGLLFSGESVDSLFWVWS